MNLHRKTIVLSHHLQRLKEYFEQAEPPENIRDKAFFLQVKEETTPIFELLGEWEEEALLAVQQRQLSLHPQQITSTKENMDLLIMHSYYKDLRKRRYMEYCKSIQYIFDQTIKEMK